MDHWLIAVLTPLFEMNPVRYTVDDAYRQRMDAKHGPRAKRVFRYQVVIAALASTGVAVTLWMGVRT